jgi:hypothetical protein
MRKIAWSAGIGCVLAYTATAANVEPWPLAEPVPVFAAETSCRATQALDPVCAAHGNDDEAMPSDLDTLSDPALLTPESAPLRAQHRAGRDFQAIAAEAGTLEQTMLPDGGTSHRLIPALLCLGGLVLLLRKRPM